MKTYEDSIKELALYLRDELQQVEDISKLDFTIDISGRVHDGELSIKFELGSAYSTGGQVSGGRIEAVLAEYMRRFGWDKRNKPLELSFAPAEVPHPDQPVGARSDEEIPF